MGNATVSVTGAGDCDSHITVVQTVADPETSERGGARNMKYKMLCWVAIFFDLFLQAKGGGGGYGPLGRPPRSATARTDPLRDIFNALCDSLHDMLCNKSSAMRQFQQGVMRL